MQAKEDKLFRTILHNTTLGLVTIDSPGNLLDHSSVICKEDSQIGRFTRLTKKTGQSQSSSMRQVSQLFRVSGSQCDWKEKDGYFAIFKCNSRYSSSVTGRVVIEILLQPKLLRVFVNNIILFNIQYNLWTAE